MNLQRYHRRHFWLEWALAGVQLLPYLTPIDLVLVSLGSLLLAVAKFRVEGLRLNFPLLLIGYLCYGVLGAGVTHLTLLAAFLYFTFKFRVYGIPSTKQHVGYKLVQLQHSQIEVFYPTKAVVGRRDKRLCSQGVWNVMFDVINKDSHTKSRLPWWVVYLTCHYYSRMTMYDTYPDARPAAGFYPVMLLSHQLGLNSLYSFAREFVDEGYVVISLIHNEEIRNRLPGLEPNKPQRIEQLANRVRDVRSALDFALDTPRFVKEMGDELKLDFSRVNIFGHSFGGSTCMSAAMADPRINGLVIAMDPCLYILPDEVSYTLNKINYRSKTLIILAEDYYATHYPPFENDYRVNIFRQNVQPGTALCYRFMGSNHASFSQMALIAEGQFRAFNVLKNNQLTTLFQQLNVHMIKALIRRPSISNEQQLLDTILSQNPSLQKQIRQVVRPLNHEEQQRRHRLYCEKMGRAETF